MTQLGQHLIISKSRDQCGHLVMSNRKLLPAWTTVRPAFQRYAHEIRWKMANSLLIFALMAVVIPASCSPQIIPLGSHNVSLDFEGQNITIMPVASNYECCLGVDTNYTKMVDKNTNSSSFAYLFSYDSPRPISDSEKELKDIMDTMCDKMSIQPYENGYISTGSDRLGGQALWGIIAPLNVKANNYTTCVEVVASFKSGTLNEHVVKTARL